MKEKNPFYLKFLFFNPVTLVMALLPFVLGFFLYTDKEPVWSICAFQNMTDLPCPSCGMTRSFTNLMHAHFQEALAHNPLVLILAPLFLFFVIIHILPKRIRIRVYHFFRNRLYWINRTIFMLGFIFLVFGIIRIVDLNTHWFGLKDIRPRYTISRLISAILLQNAQKNTPTDD